MHLGGTSIKSFEPGTFTAVAFDYTAGELGARVAERRIAVNSREQCVALNRVLPPGEYLITRPISPADADRDVWSGLPEQVFSEGDNLHGDTIRHMVNLGRETTSTAFSIVVPKAM